MGNSISQRWDLANSTGPIECRFVGGLDGEKYLLEIEATALT
jgi:hypothetical protein